jgi:hypothetical protein
MHSITDAALGPLSRYTRSDTGLPSSGPLTSVPSSIAAGGSLPGTPSSAGAGGDLAGGMAQLRLSGPQHSHDHKGDEEEGEEVQRAIAASLAEAAAAADAGAVALSEIGHTTGGLDTLHIMCDLATQGPRVHLPEPMPHKVLPFLLVFYLTFLSQPQVEAWLGSQPCARMPMMAAMRPQGRMR